MTINEIPALPPALRIVPTEYAEWSEWAQRVLAYRVLTRHLCETDMETRADVLKMCADDPLMDFIIFGAVFEPRDRMNANGTVRTKGWYPWIPYAFQVKLLRWIESVVAVTPGSPDALLGRGDGVCEKSRGMTWSWTFCGYAGSRWKYDDGFVAGLMSYNQVAVDQTGSTDSLFYKVEGFLGLDPRVPETRIMRVGETDEVVPLRSPSWMVPVGYDPLRHNQELILAHPTKTNVIRGYTTTKRTLTGTRLSVLFGDEASKFDQFGIVYNSAGEVTDHRIVGSSADIRFGTEFRDLARHAATAAQSGGPGPSFLRLLPAEHPEKNAIWREEAEARHTGSDAAKHAMSREYDIDYDAGGGGKIYPRALTIEPIALTFDPANETIDFCIDPGIRDMCAFHLVKHDPGLHRYGLLASYANSGLPADFYASLVTANPLNQVYEYTDEDERIMEWFAKYGRHIRFWVGDPAGKHRSQGTGTSFYDEFKKATYRLTDGRRPISVWHSDKDKYRYNDGRHSSLRWMLELLDVNDAPDTRRTLEAIRDHRYKAPSMTAEVTALNANPVRTWGMDRVTALEYYAVHRKFGTEALTTVATTQQRVNMSGKPVTSKKKAGYGVRAA